MEWLKGAQPVVVLVVGIVLVLKALGDLVDKVRGRKNGNGDSHDPALQFDGCEARDALTDHFREEGAVFQAIERHLDQLTQVHQAILVSLERILERQRSEDEDAKEWRTEARAAMARFSEQLATAEAATERRTTTLREQIKNDAKERHDTTGKLATALLSLDLELKQRRATAGGA